MSFPGYQPVPSRRPGWHGGRIVGSVLALLAAAAAVMGSFLSLFQGELLFQDEAQLRLKVTGWDLYAEAIQPGVPTNTFGSPVRNGYPLAAAGLLLLIAAVLGLAAARRTSSPGRKFAAALATAIGAAFLLATVLGIALQGVSLHESFRPTGAAEGNGDFTTSDSFGLGFWLVTGAAVAGVVAAVLAAVRSRRAARPSGQGDDLTTPRYGFPQPQGYQPGPQFPAPAHWPGGEPYRARPPESGSHPVPGQQHGGFAAAGQPGPGRRRGRPDPSGLPDRARSGVAGGAVA